MEKEGGHKSQKMRYTLFGFTIVGVIMTFFLIFISKAYKPVFLLYLIFYLISIVLQLTIYSKELDKELDRKLKATKKS